MINVHVGDQPQNVGPKEEGDLEYILEARNLSFWYGVTQVIEDVTINILERQITAIIGPSGCGKSTFLRCFNRMNELIPGTRISGEVIFRGQNVNDHSVDPVEVRRQIGMVFQKPNPFPKSIYDNVA